MLVSEGQVGIIIPRRNVDAFQELTPKLKKLLIDRGYTPKFIDLEFSRNYELDLALEAGRLRKN